MGLVKNENYINIQGWMVNDLKLKGNSLLVYAIIYGFTQDGQTKFTGSLQYLADWCNSTKQSIQKVLTSLVDQKLIVKEDYEINNVKFCKYYISKVDGIQLSCMGIQQSCTNNIVYNTSKNKCISKDIHSSDDANTESTNTFVLGNNNKTKKKNLYENCLDLIHDYTDDSKLTNMLVDFLKMCLEMKNISYVNQFKGRLNELDKIHDESGCSYGEIVQLSLDKCWVHFYSPKNNNNYSSIDKVIGTKSNQSHYSDENKNITEEEF